MFSHFLFRKIPLIFDIEKLCWKSYISLSIQNRTKHFMAVFIDLWPCLFTTIWNETWILNQCAVYWTARFLRQKGHIMQLSLKSRFSLISTSVQCAPWRQSSVSTYLLSFTLTQSFKGLRDHNSPDQLFCLDTVCNYQTLIFLKGLVKNCLQTPLPKWR